MDDDAARRAFRRVRAAGVVRRRCPRVLRDGAIVVRIAHDANGITVTTGDKDYRADFVVVATPPHLAGAVD
ncbi:FAD-dependent oxidoreductase [Mycobacterium sp.]|uniref:FAD-dependent oxidoreductase n=1 Tax=Mycobacterium sp. TaxID=1785 RepID=UPI003C780DF5